MARGRVITPDFWSDGNMVGVSPFARLFYIGMWNFAHCVEMEQALFALRAWLVEEERAGRAMLVVPAGQPAIPGEVDPYAIDVPTHTEKEGSR